MTLRRRLVALVVALSAIGLAVSGLVSAALLRSYALKRVDRQLEGGFGPGPGPRGGGANGGGANGGGANGGGANGGGANGGGGGPFETNNLCRPFPFNPRGILTEFYRRDGSPLCPDQSTGDPGGGPELTSTDLGRSPGRLFTVDGRTSGSYRVVLRPSEGDLLVVRAIDLRDANALWHDQALAMALVGAATLAAIGALGAWLVRRDLRPLDAVTATADAIASGDRSHRVDVVSPNTEVGRLGTAFNTMLTSIDGAFTEQQRSEDKLRAFVADASHELRTPLTSIIGYAELQMAGAADTPDRLATTMRNIRREGVRMSGLVEDLLLLAKLDQEPQLSPAPVDLRQLVDDAAYDLRATAPDRSVSVAPVPPAPVPGSFVVYGDEARLRQVLANLLANARSHTPAGTPIELGLERREGEVALRVVDHGPGIPPDQAAKVFERFARLDPSRTRASGGAGLGLAIVKAIVELHRGRVGVEATADGGATFVVWLPALP